MAKQTRKPRALSPAQRAALQAGRAKRDSNRAERAAASSPASGSTAERRARDPEPGVLPATQPVALPAPPVPQVATAIGSSIDSSGSYSASPPAAEPASSPKKPRPRTTADTLNFAFMAGDEEPGDAENLGEPPSSVVDSGASSGLASGLKGIFQSAAKLGEDGERERKSRRVVAHEKLEDEVGLAAGEMSPLVAGLFMLLMGAILGTELRPNYETSRAITLPLIRIAARHYDPLREMSPDMSDLIASAGAFSLYLQAVWPYWQQMRAERLSNSRRESARVLNATPSHRGTVPTVVPARAPEPGLGNGSGTSGTNGSTNGAIADSTPLAEPSPGGSTGLAESADDTRVQAPVIYTQPRATGSSGTDPEAILRQTVGAFY